MYFDFFDVTGSTYIAPKELVACLSVIMFVPKALFGEVVLSKVFAHSDPGFYSESEFELFVSMNREFESEKWTQEGKQGQAEVLIDKVIFAADCHKLRCHPVR
jgi:hypothetical protein